ncbi:unnamed protein product [Brassica rapa]|uniref:Uncharacterized protein n=2 Tax=Brassica TaxID=3705 RepID=A0A8D9I2D6_BRACM|nr:unnamed protein product [Brassica napus]CAG7909860.1 unnamed protein product [Brassica rapa]
MSQQCKWILQLIYRDLLVFSAKALDSINGEFGFLENRCSSSVGAAIVKRALSYPLTLTAKNAGVNGSVVSEKVVRCCLGHAASVAKTFFMSNYVVVEIKGAKTSYYWQPNEQFRLFLIL